MGIYREEKKNENEYLINTNFFQDKDMYKYTRQGKCTVKQ